MEEPLRDTQRLLTALRLLGHGMARLGTDEGEAVAHVAWEASGRLDTVWDKAHDVAAGRK